MNRTFLFFNWTHFLIKDKFCEMYFSHEISVKRCRRRLVHCALQFQRRGHKTEPGGLRINFSDIGGPTVVGVDAKEIF